jgi:hypothetical protein
MAACAVALTVPIAEQVLHRRLCLRRQVVLGDEADDLVDFAAPGEANTREQEQQQGGERETFHFAPPATKGRTDFSTWHVSVLAMR